MMFARYALHMCAYRIGGQCNNADTALALHL